MEVINGHNVFKEFPEPNLTPDQVDAAIAEEIKKAKLASGEADPEDEDDEEA